jgi:hypothetical protein
MRRLLPLFALALAVSAPATAQERESGTPWHWSGDIAKDRTVYVRNLNGAVRVEQGTGSKVEVTAEKHWRRGNPEDVKITVQQVGAGKGDVLVCALWRDGDRCDEDGYHSSHRGWGDGDHNDTSVEFTVKLPAGVRMDGSTVNGAVDIDGATSSVVARTVNGGVSARSTGGPVSAETVNGSINVRTASLGGDRTDYKTVNGSITVDIAEGSNVDLDMSTVNGNVSSDFPITIEGNISRKHIRGTLGKGGPTVRLSTVNGSIRLRKA